VKTLIGILLAAASLGATAAEHNYHERPEGKALIQRLSEQHGMDAGWVRDMLAEAQYQPRIVEAMRRPAEKVLPWHEYRQIFLGESRIADGAAFMRRHRDTLERAQAETGVPAALITAIIGVETRYGRYLGRDRVLDALATLGFDYPERADFFRSELGHFLRLCHEEDIDATGAVGSYAGAMGMPQFIPSSYRAYAVDFDENGQRDLWQPADAIGSVANYLSEHGWRSHHGIAFPAEVAGSTDGLARSRRKTKYRYEALADAGVTLQDAPAGDTEVGLIELEGENGPEYWLGLKNFFVITSYNHSRMYAMAVYQLSQAIDERVASDAETTAHR